MGNSSTKEARPSGARSRSGDFQSPTSPISPGAAIGLSHASSNNPGFIYPTRTRSSGQELYPTGGAALDAALEPRKETRQEREARKAEKERVARAKERERSLREEGVDGGYLVTLGTYVGAEDFSKPMVRQLMIERRVAPFWRGLNDHSDSWTEYQLVAVARGLPLPAPDEVPKEDQSEASNTSTQPIAVRFKSPHELSTGIHNLNAVSPSSAPMGTSPLFRGRSKTLASLTGRNGSQSDLVSQEMRLPHDPQVNGQPIEAYLYKDAAECPICFLYYPPFLNRTRCCDQPICSECFVQIKRPDPHPPEHTDPSLPMSPEAQRQAEEGLLVSEPAQCPFCVQPEFGITYDPPPFRRGLAYPTHGNGRSSSFALGSAMSSSPTLHPPTGASLGSSMPGRRRATSLSATAPQVITTDKVRPDWAKKLSDARAQAARRSAAATALHNAAYIMGSLEASGSRFRLGRRPRNLIDTGGAPGGPREGVPIPNMEMLLSALEGHHAAVSQDNSERGRARMGSHGSRTDDLEELMLMEAIRQSLASEEDRRRKEEKEQVKQAKKDEKAKAKEQKKVEKAVKKGAPYSTGNNGSTSFYAANAMPSFGAGTVFDGGKGKAKVGPSSVSPAESGSASPASLEASSSAPWTTDSRTAMQDPFGMTHQQSQQMLAPSSGLRHVSDASSSGSSINESMHGSMHHNPAGSDSSFNASPNISGQDLPLPTHQLQAQEQGHSSFAHDTSPEATSAGVSDSSIGYRSLAAMMVREQVDEGAGHGVDRLTENSQHANPTVNQSGEDVLQPIQEIQRAMPVEAVQILGMEDRSRDRKQHDINVIGHGLEPTVTQ